MALEAGRVVSGKYKLQKPLAAGGMGAVWIAEQQPLGRNVAFKVLKKPSDAAEARFFREMQALARISHAHVVTVYDSGRTEDGALYLAMELVDGPTLREELSARGRVSEQSALEIVKQIASGLAAAHERKIAHLDLKPENIVVQRTSHGREVKILDFGIARILEGPAALASSPDKTQTAGITEEGVAVGTPGYMSPEQLLGVRDDVRSDLYALGVIWFELLTGRAPFTGATTAEIAAKTLTQAAPAPTEVIEGCATKPTEALLSTLLARDPNGRPKDAGELAQRLDRLASPSSSSPDAPTISATVSATAATRVRDVVVDAPAEKKPIGVFIGGAFVLAVIVASATLATRVGRPPEGPVRLAVLGFDDESGPDSIRARIVADTLAHSMAGLNGLRVVSPLVVGHALKEHPGDPLQAVTALGVDFAVTGTVRDGPPLHVVANLNNLRNGDAAESTLADGASPNDVVHDLVPKLEERVIAASGGRVVREPVVAKSEAVKTDADFGGPSSTATLNHTVKKPTDAAPPAQGPEGGAMAVREDPGHMPIDKVANKLNASVNDDGRKTLSKDAMQKAETNRNEGGKSDAAMRLGQAKNDGVMMVSEDMAAYADFVNGVRQMTTNVKNAEELLANATVKDPTAQAAWVHLAVARAAITGSFATPGVLDALAHVSGPATLPVMERHMYDVLFPFAHGDAKAALDAAKRMRDADDTDPLAWALLSFAWDANHDLDQAASCMQKAVDRSPDMGLMQRALFEMRTRKGERAAAVEGLRKYAQKHPDDVDTQAALAALKP